MFYRIVFMDEATVDCTVMTFDDNGRPVKCLTKFGVPVWIGNFKLVELLTDLGESYDGRIIRKVGF